MKTPGLLFLLTLYIMLSSCGGNHNQTSDNNALALDTFSEIPEEIDGCSCLLAENSSAFRNNEFLYADNLQDMGFVRIDSQFVRITLDEAEHDSETVIFTSGSNEQLTLEIDLRKADQIDYVGAYHGTLKITTKDGKTIKKTVFGECGC